MSRPRKNQTGLPSYCYRDKRGRLYMLRPEDGKLKRQTYATQEALLAAWRATWGDAAREGAASVGDLLDGFLVDLGKRVGAGEIAASTAADYTRCAMSLRPLWTAVRIEDVDVPMLYRWRDARGEGSRTRANRERTVLSDAFHLGVKHGHMKDNPARFLQPFKEKARTRYVTDAEFVAVYKLAPPIVQAAMLLAMVTGLRQGDILRVRRSDFGDSGLTVQTRKTGQPMHYAWTEGLRRAVLAAVGVRDFVPLVLLSTAEGKPYTSTGFQTAWQRTMTAAMAAGLPERFTFNDLRAKAGSESRDWKLLGHLDQRTFERVYNRLPRKVTPTR